MTDENTEPPPPGDVSDPDGNLTAEPLNMGTPMVGADWIFRDLTNDNTNGAHPRAQPNPRRQSLATISGNESVPSQLAKMSFNKRKASSPAKGDVDGLQRSTPVPVSATDVVSIRLPDLLRAYQYTKVDTGSSSYLDLAGDPQSRSARLSGETGGDNDFTGQRHAFPCFSAPGDSPEKHEKFAAIIVQNFEPPNITDEDMANHNRMVNYLPLRKSLKSSGTRSTDVVFELLESHQHLTQRNANSQILSAPPSWPASVIPVEIFASITQYLPKENIKTLRLVNKEFEKKVSGVVFHTSTVPFNVELYDMIDNNVENTGGVFSHNSNTNDHHLTTDSQHHNVGTLAQQDGKESGAGKIHKGYGLRMFQGFGPHIKQFGMSFEVSEAQLAQIKVKPDELDNLNSYFGRYTWPSPEYKRFASVARLERVADEISQMKSAFSELKEVSQLALSIDSGLGWLNGPDKSPRARIFEQPSAVFGSKQIDIEHRLNSAEMFWNALRTSHESIEGSQNMTEIVLGYKELIQTPSQLKGLQGTDYEDTKNWSSIPARMLMPEKENLAADPKTSLGLLYTTSGSTVWSWPKSAVKPSKLRKEQNEWLLEMDWAQRAFLESYVMAVTDNVDAFQAVTTLNIAKLSSGYLPLIAKRQFWDSLQCLENFTLHVKAAWRSVGRDEAGYAATKYQNPSQAVDLFYHHILQQCVSRISTIKKLNIGWFDGGEHAEGIFARNSHVLPAPITTLASSTSGELKMEIDCVVLPTLEELTLHNCWITPMALLRLVTKHADKALKHLVLDSVSFTANPGIEADRSYYGQLNAVNPNLLLPAQLAIAAGHPAAAPAPALPPASSQEIHWTDDHRKYSWPDVLNAISPGPVFADYLPAPEPWETAPTRPQTNLISIKLISCGYVVLSRHAPFCQRVFASHVNYDPSPWFSRRRENLEVVMMSTDDIHAGVVLQWMPSRELQALSLAWGMRTGWDDYEKALGPEYDGHRPGGTGRFTGTIERDMGLIVPESDDLIEL